MDVKPQIKGAAVPPKLLTASGPAAQRFALTAGLPGHSRRSGRLPIGGLTDLQKGDAVPFNRHSALIFQSSQRR